eukprot:581577_1
MVNNWTPSNIFVLLLCIVTFIGILWNKYLFANGRYWSNKTNSQHSQDITTAFWSSSQHFIHDLRLLCLQFVGIVIDSQLLESNCEENSLYSLLLTHFKEENRFYFFKNSAIIIAVSSNKWVIQRKVI